MKISQRDRELLYGHDVHSEILKGASFRKNIGGVKFLNLCTSSDDALYLYKDS